MQNNCTHLTTQAREPALASFLHTSIIMHASPERSLSFFLGNKLSSPTLLGVQLTRLFLDAYTDDPVCIVWCMYEQQGD